MGEAGASSPARLLALTSGSPTDAPLQHTELGPWNGAGGQAATLGSEEAALQLRPYNQRIELPAIDDLSDGEGKPRRLNVNFGKALCHQFSGDI